MTLNAFSELAELANFRIKLLIYMDFLYSKKVASLGEAPSLSFRKKILGQDPECFVLPV